MLNIFILRLICKYFPMSVTHLTLFIAFLGIYIGSDASILVP